MIVNVYDADPDARARRSPNFSTSGWWLASDSNSDQHKEPLKRFLFRARAFRLVNFVAPRCLIGGSYSI